MKRSRHRIDLCGIEEKVINTYFHDILERISKEAFHICKIYHIKILTTREVEIAANLILTGEYAKRAMSKGMNVLFLNPEKVFQFVILPMRISTHPGMYETRSVMKKKMSSRYRGKICTNIERGYVEFTEFWEDII